MLVVDTNVLVYAADHDSPFYAACRDWLERQRVRADAWYTTWPIVYEFLRVTTHPRVMRRPWDVSAAWDFVVALLASPGLGILVPTSGTLMWPHRLSGSFLIWQAIFSMTRIPPFSCASTESGGSVPAMLTSIALLL
jgi:hypothetical protein